MTQPSDAPWASHVNQLFHAVQSSRSSAICSMQQQAGRQRLQAWSSIVTVHVSRLQLGNAIQHLYIVGYQIVTVMMHACPRGLQSIYIVAQAFTVSKQVYMRAVLRALPWSWPPGIRRSGVQISAPSGADFRIPRGMPASLGSEFAIAGH